MPTKFADSRKRVERAIMHAKAFAEEWHRVGDPKGYTSSEKKEGERTIVFSLMASSNVLQNSLALELGEFFYQLRAALDSAMWYACSLTLRTDPPPDVENRVDFPIYVDAGRFKKATFHWFKLPEKLAVWLEAIQPYPVRKGVNDREAFLRFALERIHDCARKDRHRRLHIIVSTLTDIEYSFIFDPPAHIVAVEGIPCNILEGESDFLRITMEPAAVGEFRQKVGLASVLTVDISCNEIPASGIVEMSKALQKMVDTVTQVIDRFEAEF